MTVNDIEADQQWNAEPRLLHGEALHLSHVLGAHHVEQVADRAVLDRLGRIARNDGPGDGITGSRHGQLTQLFRQCHCVQQGLDAAHSVRASLFRQAAG